MRWVAILCSHICFSKLGNKSCLLQRKLHLKEIPPKQFCFTISFNKYRFFKLSMNFFQYCDLYIFSLFTFFLQRAIVVILLSKYDVYIIAYLEAFRKADIYQNIYNILFHNSKLSAAYYRRDQCIYVYQ